MQYEIFLEGGQERKTGYYKKRVSIIKAVIFKELINIRENSFNMTRGGGDEDIEGGAPKIFRHPKGGALKKLLH